MLLGVTYLETAIQSCELEVPVVDHRQVFALCLDAASGVWEALQCSAMGTLRQCESQTDLLPLLRPAVSR